jgi:hypothetical protein
LNSRLKIQGENIKIKNLSNGTTFEPISSADRTVPSISILPLYC